MCYLSLKIGTPFPVLVLCVGFSSSNKELSWVLIVSIVTFNLPQATKAFGGLCDQDQG